MTSSLNKRQLNRQRWFDRTENYHQSGLSQKAFCEQHRIGVASFRRWRAIFAREGKPAAKPVSLLPVSILPAVSVPNLALHFGGDLRLEISPGFDAVMLQQVVAVLQAS